MPSAQSHRFALAVLIFGACTIGLAPILVRLTETGPAAAGFWRLSFALPLLLIPVLREHRKASEGWRWGLVAGALFAADLGCWHYGVVLTSVANATVFSNATPVIVTAFTWLVLKEKVSKTFLAALALALGGAVTMAVAKGSGGLGADPPLGNGLAALTAVFYGAYFLVIRHARSAASASNLMFWSSLAGAPLLLVASLGMGERLLPAGPGGWAACVGLGVMHVAGQGAIAWALGRLPAPTISVVVLVQPVVAAGLGWLVFGERVAPVQALGAAVLLAGVVLAQRSSAKTRNGPEVAPGPAETLPSIEA
jgi:drug/metabolite transporter (DMT)-like permease